MTNKPNSLPFSLLLLALLFASVLVVDAHNVICKCHRVHGHKKHNHKGDGQHGGVNANGTLDVTVSQNGTAGGNQSSSYSSSSSSTSSNVTMSQSNTGAGDQNSSSSSSSTYGSLSSNSTGADNQTPSTPLTPPSSSSSNSYDNTGTGNQTTSSSSPLPPSSSSPSSDISTSQNITTAGNQSSSSSLPPAYSSSSSLPPPYSSSSTLPPPSSSSLPPASSYSSSSSTINVSQNITGAGNQATSSSIPPSSSSSSSSSSTSTSTYVDGSSNAGSVGLCFGRSGDNLPSPSVIVQLLKSHRISKVRLFVPIPAVLTALKGTGIRIMIGVPNENIMQLSSGGADAALAWLKTNVLAFVDASQVCYLAVGNEVLHTDASLTPYLVPAMYNFYKALQTLGLDSSIKLSSPCSSQILSVWTPPSNGAFAPFCLPAVQSMLKFLSETGAPFMVNMQPFHSFINDPVSTNLNFCLFQAKAQPMLDNGLQYTNMFDVMLDALATAMEREGFKGIPVMVTETGWPTAGNNVATPDNAAAYIGGILERRSHGVGTPKRPNQAVEVFLSDMFNENTKGGQEFEKHFGIFQPDGSPVINVTSFT
ncbi:unnamed protein product [Musa banksii]